MEFVLTEEAVLARQLRDKKRKIAVDEQLQRRDEILSLKSRRHLRLKEIRDQLTCKCGQYTKYIYALVDPGSNAAVYYGNTNRPSARYLMHLRHAAEYRTAIHRYIYDLAVREHELPRMRLIIAMSAVSGDSLITNQASHLVERFLIGQAAKDLPVSLELEDSPLLNEAFNPKNFSI